MRFTGRQTPAQVLAWLQAADAFALASSNEGFPCSLLEAMSAGLPSLVSNIPANAQLIKPGIHGMHFPVGDEQAIAEALHSLRRDANLRARMGAAARELAVSEYSVHSVIARYEKLFHAAIG